MRLYEKGLGELKRMHMQVLNNQERHKDISARLEELEDELIRHKGEINTYQPQVDRLKKRH
ncbi:MAG: hypothetical protein LRY37_05235 [Alkalibacterium thalassium]|nr:hypothetical protein [Alkalibacterium thalassium]